MKLKLIVCLFLILGASKVVAEDECEQPNNILDEDYAECEQYQVLHPNFRWDVYMAEMASLTRLICLGAHPEDPPGAHTVNMYGRFISKKCVTENPKIADKNKAPNRSCGSIVEVSNKVIGEVIPLKGTSFDLVYFTNRVIGRKADYIITVPVTPLIFTPTESVVLNARISDAFDTTLFSGSYTDYAPPVSFEWNGLENGNESWGKASLKIVTDKTKVGFRQRTQTTIVNVGNLKAKKLGVGGWFPSIWHFYDHSSKTLFKGDGSSVQVAAVQDGGYYRVANENGSEVYYFDNIGKITHTRTALTGAVIFTFGYDSTERLVTITEPFNRVTTFSRNVFGTLKAIVAPNGAKASIAINSHGYMSKLVNPNNETFLMTYDGAGGLMKSFMPPHNDLSTFVYDSLGNLISDVHASGHSVTLSNYPGLEFGITNTSAEGVQVHTSYVPTESREQTRMPSGHDYYKTTYFNSTQYSTPSSSMTYNFGQDPRFNAQVKVLNFKSIDNFGSRQTFFTREATLFSPSDLYSINEITDIETISDSKITSIYDGSTRTKNTTTKLGKTYKIQIDEYERPILSQQGDMIAQDYYYSNNLLTKITQGSRKLVLSYYSNELLKSMKNALNQVTTFTYDAAQRLKTKTLPDSRIITYSYDSNGNLTSITPPGRAEHKLEFGLNNELSSYEPPMFTGVSNVNTNYTYNNDNKLTKITRPDGEEIGLNYDQLTGQLLTMTGSFETITREYSKDLVSRHYQGTNTIFQFYDGDVVSDFRSVVDGVLIYEYLRNPENHAGEKIGSETIRSHGPGSVERNINYGYDSDEYLTSAGDLKLSYNVPNGQLTQTILGKVKDHYYYNSFGELRKYVAKFKSNIIYEYELQRDTLGRVIKKIETLNGVTSTHDYVFDSTGRLIEVSKNGAVDSTYIYDSNSNRIGGSVRGEVTTAIYDAQDRLTSYNGLNLIYNANGEIQSKGNSNFVYDVFGSLNQYTKGNLTVNYEVDPLQRRSGRIVKGTLKNRYVLSPEGRVVGLLDSNNKLTKTFVYASKRHVPDYYIDQNNNKFRIITDHLGSIRIVISKSGRVLQLMEHDEFGKILQDTRPGLLPFGFAGGLYDVKTSLIRFGARDYDPETGRWLSKDPIRFEGGDTNLYGYVLQDPVNGIDPSGLAVSPFPGLFNPNGNGGAIGGIIGGAIGGSIGTGVLPGVGTVGGTIIGGQIGGAIGGALTGGNGLDPNADVVPHGIEYNSNKCNVK